MKVEIEMANNGFIVKDLSEIPPEEVPEVKVFEHTYDTYNDDNECEQETLKHMFYYLMEIFGTLNSKHNKTNLNIEVEKNIWLIY